MQSVESDGGRLGPLRRVLKSGCWLCRWQQAVWRVGLFGIAAGYVALACVVFFRPDPADGMGSVETALAWLSLMGTTFVPHAGVALVVWLAVLARAKAYKTIAVGVPLLVLSLGPWVWSFAPSRNVGPVAKGTMLVLSANLLGSSRSDVELLEQIAAHEPEVIVLQEVQAASLARLESALAGRYQVAAAPREHLFGGAIFSRLPFTRAARIVYPTDGLDLPQIMVWVEFEGREVCVFDIHLLPPTGRTLVAGQATLSHELGPVLDEVFAEGVAAIVAGDFNSPWGGQPLKVLRTRGFREAHRSAGTGLGATWPTRGVLSLPPGIRIDHVAFSPGMVCVEAWVGEATSSDHRPIFARLGWARE